MEITNYYSVFPDKFVYFVICVALMMLIVILANKLKEKMENGTIIQKLLTFKKERKYELLIGISKRELEKKFPWLRDADLKEAIITITPTGSIEWLDGIWKKGRWEEGIWRGGIWENGTWVNGVWKRGLWLEGEWKNGVWEDGIWWDGVWIDGIWKDGAWLSGIWEKGKWEKGKMWDNLKQKFVDVKYDEKNKIFKEIKNENKKRKANISL